MVGEGGRVRAEQGHPFRYELRLLGNSFRVFGLGFKIQGLGSGFRVSGLGFGWFKGYVVVPDEEWGSGSLQISFYSSLTGVLRKLFFPSVGSQALYKFIRLSLKP